MTRRAKFARPYHGVLLVVGGGGEGALQLGGGVSSGGVERGGLVGGRGVAQRGLQPGAYTRSLQSST